MPPISNRDIAHCLNQELVNMSKGTEYAAINCAVEESKISSRDSARLLPQDEFVRDHISDNDILLISVGGNDIALATNPCTIISMLTLICCSTTSCISNCSCGCDIPIVGDPICLGGSCLGCMSNCCAFPIGLGYFIHLFKTKLENYVKNLIKNKRPKVIGICMIYFPFEDSGNSWADTVLGILGYDKNPKKLQSLIKTIFELAIKRISIPGSRVVAIPLYDVLDGKCKKDYVQRVEPSAEGGIKMSRFILRHLL
jgi:hypothetical protein